MTNLRLMILAHNFGILVGMILIGIGAPRMLNALRLADEGKAAVAKVVASKVEPCGRNRSCNIYSLSADGHQFQMILAAIHSLGQEVAIVYSPRDIKVALPGKKSASRWIDVYRRAYEQKDLDVTLGLAGIIVVVAGLIALGITLGRNAAPQKPTGS